MIYVISKATFGDCNVRDIQCNANWCSCPYSDYALIPDNLVDGILATCGYCDITLNSDGTEVVSFVAREKPPTTAESVCPVLIESKEEFHSALRAELDSMPVGGVKTIYVNDPNYAVGVDSTGFTVTMHKCAYNPFSDFYEHGEIASLEIHGNGVYTMFSARFYNSDGAGREWQFNLDPSMVLTEVNTADRITEKGTTDGWTWERWKSGKFEAWRYFNESVGGAIDIGEGNYFRYKYQYQFDLPFESMITPHVFISLRSDGNNLLVGVNPEEGSIWYDASSLSDALVDVCGQDLQDVALAFSEVGISSQEFFAALNACNGDESEFVMALLEHATSEEIMEAMAYIPLTDDQLQEAFNNTDPSRGSVCQTFTVLSPYQESAHKVNADIHVIGTWKHVSSNLGTSAVLGQAIIGKMILGTEE